MTCWRRLAAWNEAGVQNQLHQLLLNQLRSKDQLAWSRAVNPQFRIPVRWLVLAVSSGGPQPGPALRVDGVDALLASWGEPRYRGDQVWDACYRRRVPLETATDLPAALRGRLVEALPLAFGSR